MVCSYIEGVPIAKRLNELGISAVIVYYRVGKAARYPAPQEDLARAVRELLARGEELMLDTGGYSIWGASAGGHLAAAFGTQSMGYRRYSLPAPGALVLSYPVISMDKTIIHTVTHDMLLGEDATEDEERAKSVNLHVTETYPPTYIWCGDSDASVPPENTCLMAEALKSAGVDCMCEIFPGVPHGAGPATGSSAEGWIDSAAEFWLGRRGG